MRVCQHAAGVNHKASAIALARRHFDIPQTFAVVVSQPGDGLACSGVFSNPEFFDDVVRIFEQLALGAVGMGWKVGRRGDDGFISIKLKTVFITFH